MRKKLLILLFFFISYGAYAQVELGFKFTPTISSSRLNSNSDDFNYSSDGVGIRFAAGPFADFAFRENYYFSTGVFLVSNRSAFEITDKNNTVRYKEEYGVQYIQIPVAIKLYTNEIALDKRIYFQVGTTMEFNVKEKEKEEEYFVVENFRFFNSTLQVGFGLDYKIGLNTSLFAGVSYNRGLVNLVGDRSDMVDKFSLKNDYFGLDLGVKF